MAEFMRKVALDSPNALVSTRILRNAELSQLATASIMVDRGTDPDEMVRNARYQTLFTVSRQ